MALAEQSCSVVTTVEWIQERNTLIPITPPPSFLQQYLILLQQLHHGVTHEEHVGLLVFAVQDKSVVLLKESSKVRSHRWIAPHRYLCCRTERDSCPTSFPCCPKVPFPPTPFSALTRVPLDTPPDYTDPSSNLVSGKSSISSALRATRT